VFSAHGGCELRLLSGLFRTSLGRENGCSAVGLVLAGCDRWVTAFFVKAVYPARPDGVGHGVTECSLETKDQ
jgi:hypothetical protein